MAFKILLLTSLLSWSQASPTFMSKSTKDIEALNMMRESLVKAVPKNPDQNTFKQVCKPVGMQAKNLANKNNWLVKQASQKYRNPSHKADSLEVEALKKFESNKKLISFFEIEGERLHYFRRIDVKKECLACHGSKASRPEFIKIKYPDDKAYGFSEGDLRGLYHVISKK